MLNKIQISVKRLDHSKGLALPKIQTKLSAGVDLSAAIKSPVILRPSERKIIPTGLVVALPIGFEAQIRPRSGLAIKSGITVLNSPGTIDADYRGEIGVILVNHGDEVFQVDRGLRIAQMVIAVVETVAWTETDKLSTSDRGAGGFGSTG